MAVAAELSAAKEPLVLMAETAGPGGRGASVETAAWARAAACSSRRAAPVHVNQSSFDANVAGSRTAAARGNRRRRGAGGNGGNGGNGASGLTGGSVGGTGGNAGNGGNGGAGGAGANGGNGGNGLGGGIFNAGSTDINKTTFVAEAALGGGPGPGGSGGAGAPPRTYWNAWYRGGGPQ